MILHMPRLSFVTSCLFWLFALFIVLFGHPVGAQRAESVSPLAVTRDSEKTVYTVEGARTEDTQNAGKASDVLQNLRIDMRGEDGKGSNSDRRGRGEHP